MKHDDFRHLEFMYQRMKDVHNESENTDYMIRFRNILNELGAGMPVINCHYCNGKATDDMLLFRMYAPGTYFQHWNYKWQKGCDENLMNSDPLGVRHETI